MTGWKRFENTGTEVLIGHYQIKDNDESLRDDAFLALCFRFRGDIIRKCEIICKNRGYNIDVATEITDNTFKKYGKSGSFKVEKARQISIDDSFILYLYGIAKKELINYYNLELKRKNGQLYSGTEEIITTLPNIDIEKLDLESKIIHEILLSLPYSHQVIYLTYKTFEKSGVNLPKKLQAALRNHLGGINQNTVRTYKKEAIDKIEGAKSIMYKMKVQQ